MTVFLVPNLFLSGHSLGIVSAVRWLNRFYLLAKTLLDLGNSFFETLMNYQSIRFSKIFLNLLNSNYSEQIVLPSV
ncbi:hypothetical protein DL96DRAFT_1628038 [Flagelloscypha sp. PMI_526]|nr:hypothetical protein DL96DRAFT_1628038 [Flagelloscypha sp. PMI_526]